MTDLLNHFPRYFSVKTLYRRVEGTPTHCLVEVFDTTVMRLLSFSVVESGDGKPLNKKKARNLCLTLCLQDLSKRGLLKKTRIPKKKNKVAKKQDVDCNKGFCSLPSVSNVDFTDRQCSNVFKPHTEETQLCLQNLSQ